MSHGFAVDAAEYAWNAVQTLNVTTKSATKNENFFREDNFHYAISIRSDCSGRRTSAQSPHWTDNWPLIDSQASYFDILIRWLLQQKKSIMRFLYSADLFPLEDRYLQILRTLNLCVRKLTTLLRLCEMVCAPRKKLEYQERTKPLVFVQRAANAKFFCIASNYKLLERNEKKTKSKAHSRTPLAIDYFVSFVFYWHLLCCLSENRECIKFRNTIFCGCCCCFVSREWNTEKSWRERVRYVWLLK